MNDQSSSSRPVPVPATRAGRLVRVGGLATGVAGAMLVDGVARLSRGERANPRDLFLTPANIRRVTDQLAKMRGAAMKVGQLVSMDPGEMMPPELAEIMSRLRADADYMPPRQLRDVLDANWGPGWRRGFAAFDVRPIAAASIGQVHRARLPDGREVAVKVQYPGVRASIDSDVANVGALLKMSGMVPQGLSLKPLLDEARRQLREEADYLHEAGALRRFGALLAEDARFMLPCVFDALTTRDVLVMDFVEGVAVESLLSAPQATRDQVATRLITLLLKELFEFRLMQTDPNFANYRYAPDADRVILLDFGATRAFSDEVVEACRGLLRSGLAGSDDIEERALATGLFGPDTEDHHRRAVLEVLEIVFAVLRSPEVQDFSDPALLRRLRAAGEPLALDRSFAHVPPMDILYVQRKVAGTFLLCAKLGARIAVRPLVSRYL